jgi:hypothetical protein
MTPEQRLDRLGRIARLMYEAGLRCSREARKQTAKRCGTPRIGRKLYNVRLKTLTRLAKNSDIQSKTSPVAGQVELNVESKMDHVAFLHDVVLAFQSQQSTLACARV